MSKTHATAKKSVPTVRPCKRADGKFEAVAADGTVNPYAFRTEADAWASLGGKPGEQTSSVPEEDEKEI